MYDVLVVEDDTFLRQGIAEILGIEGYNTIQATNGAEALVSMQKHTPHIILCNAQMPKLTGFELLSIVKSNLALKHIPVIFITGLVEAERLLAEQQLGVNAIVKKPFEIKDLLALVSQCLP